MSLERKIHRFLFFSKPTFPNFPEPTTPKKIVKLCIKCLLEENMDSCFSKAPFFQLSGFGPLCLISIPYQKCTGTDLFACEPDVLSSSAHPPQRSISGSFPLSGMPGKLIIFSLYFSCGTIFIVILTVKVELVKENTFFPLRS